MTIVLHAGAHLKSPADLEAFPAPQPSGRHFPVAHSELRSLVLEGIEARGLGVTEERVGLTSSGDRYFGLLSLNPGDLALPDDWTMTLGIRGSYDRSFAASLVGGSRVFVCDNLAFSGEVKVARKNTRFVRRDLPGRINAGLDALLGEADRQRARFARYHAAEFTERDVDDAIMALVRADALPGSKIRGVLREFEAPRFSEHGTGTAWSFFNAVTETFRDTNAERLVSRTIHLHNVVDASPSVAALN